MLVLMSGKGCHAMSCLSSSASYYAPLRIPLVSRDFLSSEETLKI